MEKQKLLNLAVPAACIIWLLFMIITTPRETVVGTWSDGDINTGAGKHILINFRSDGTETQSLTTPQGTFIGKGKYFLDGIALQQTFISTSLDGKLTALPKFDPSESYRCKVAGNGLELDSRALARDIPGEHYLPLDGKQILLFRREVNKQ